MAITLNITSFTPSFLNMSGQMGIFRANGRLGFWDSSNSVSWNALYDMTDFTPSIETRAGNATFNNILGRIVTIKPQGTGFVIYSTKGIVGVLFSNDVNLIWDAVTIADNCGIAYPRNVTTGITSLEHYAYTSAGIKHIGNYDGISKQHKYDDIVPEVFDMLRESRLPVYLDFLNDRFLFISTLDDKFIYGLVSVSRNSIQPYTIRILQNGGQTDIYVPGEVIAPDTNIQDKIIAEAQTTVTGEPDEITRGVFTKWDSVSGERMVPSRIPSAIYPYNVNDYKTHIDNTGLDLSSQYGPADLVKLINGYANYFDENPIATSPGQIDMGWTYHGKNITSSIATLGYTDAFLNEAVQTQNDEWSNFQTIQVNTQAAINGYPPITKPLVEEYFYSYVDSHALAVATVDARIAAKVASSVVPPITDNHTYIYSGTDIGWGFTGNRSITGPTITSVGATNAKCEMSAVFTNTFGVQLRDYSVYTIVDDLNWASVTYHAKINNSTLFSSNTHSCNPLLDTNYGATYSYTGPPVGFYGIDPDDALTDRYNACPSTITVTRIASGYQVIYNKQPYTHLHTFSGTVYYIAGVDLRTLPAPETGKWGLNTPTGTVMTQANINLSATNITVQHRTKVTTSDYIQINTAAHADEYHLSKFESYQKKLEWAVISPTVPENDPIYTTFIYANGSVIIPPLDFPALNVLPLYLDVTYPGATFLLQDGSPAPLYPTMKGSLVVDTSLKKWGKMKADFKQLLDMSPINVISPTIPYTNFGVDMALVKANGSVVLLDSKPTDSWMRYGKIGYYRLGMTGIEEVKATFRRGSDVEIILDTSMDAVYLESSLRRATAFTNIMGATVYDSTMGRYHTITISGNFDLQYLELRATITGRR